MESPFACAKLELLNSMGFSVFWAPQHAWGSNDHSPTNGTSPGQALLLHFLPSTGIASADPSTHPDLD